MRNQQKVISHQWIDEQDYLDLHVSSKSKSNSEDVRLFKWLRFPINAGKINSKNI
jgi:hypothetical protein